jgi:two-component system, chemotaxis family, chemotaxis protein CheY
MTPASLGQDQDRSGTVLVIDDDWRIRELVQLALEESGFSVKTVPDGEKAIALIRAERPAALVLDLTLPRADGFAVAEAVREVHGDEVPIVVVTGDHSGREKALAIGAVGHLGKPFDLDELTDLVRSALEGA